MSKSISCYTKIGSSNLSAVFHLSLSVCQGLTLHMTYAMLNLYYVTVFWLSADNKQFVILLPTGELVGEMTGDASAGRSGCFHMAICGDTLIVPRYHCHQVQFYQLS